MAYGGILSYGNDGESPGVQRNLTPQNTEGAAAQALVPQQYGDEFKPQPNPDIETLVARLNEVELEKSRLCQKLYGPMNWYEEHSEPYKGPPYLERERLNREMNRLDEECYSIKAQLRQLVDAFLSSDGGEPYTGNAKVISPD